MDLRLKRPKERTHGGSGIDEAAQILQGGARTAFGDLLALAGEDPGQNVGVVGHGDSAI